MITTFDDFAAWLDDVKDSRVQAYLSARGGGLGELVCACEPGQGDAETFWNRLRDVVVQTSKRPSRDFILVTRDKKGNDTHPRETVRMLRDDSGIAAVSEEDNTIAKVVATLGGFTMQVVAGNEKLVSHVIEQSKVHSDSRREESRVTLDAVRGVLGEMSARMKHHEEALDSVLQNMLAMAMLKFESETAAHASAEKRVLVASAIGELGPAIQTILAGVFKAGVDKHVDALVRSLKPEQFVHFAQGLNAEQKVILENILKAKAEAEEAATKKAADNASGKKPEAKGGAT